MRDVFSNFGMRVFRYAKNIQDEGPRSRLRGILRNSPKPLPSFAKATEGSPRLHPRSKLQGIRRRRIKEVPCPLWRR